MKKIFDERGFLTKEGEKSSQINNFKHACMECLEKMSVQEIQIMGSILHKIVGDMVFDTAQHIRDENNKFAAMSDEEFEKYLDEKYSKYGSQWRIKVSLTEEEGTRLDESTKRKIQKWADDLKKNPPKFTRSGIPPRGRGKYID